MTPSVILRIVVMPKRRKVESFKEVNHAVVLEFLRFVADESDITLLSVFMSVSTGSDRNIHDGINRPIPFRNVRNAASVIEWV
jgi:hypothetical protein